VPQDEHDTGRRDGPATDEREELKRLQRDKKELRKANEILRLASVLCAGEARRPEMMVAFIDRRRATVNTDFILPLFTDLNFPLFGTI
jgi:transposase-like protein